MRSILVLMIFAALAGIPAIESEEIDVIQASEIIEKIEIGETVDYSHVAIEGDLNISKIYMSRARHVASPIRISDSTIRGFINFDGIILEELTNFERTEFMKPASFIGTQFENDAIFKDTRFDEASLFIGSEFNNLAQFQYTEFNAFADFLGAKFKGKQDFQNSRFNKTAFFGSVAFEDDTNFENAIFIGSANFRESIFDNARFSGAKFKESVDFNLARFNKSADFIGTIFNKELYFNNIKFGRLSISWDSINDKLICNGPTYLLLIRNFKDMEQVEDADNCYYQYRDEKRQKWPLGWSMALDYLAFISCGYGVRWQNTMLTGIWIMILFGIYFSLKVGILDPEKSERLQKLKESIFFSLTILLSAPTDWYVTIFGIDKYRDIVLANRYSIFLERVIGWSLLILLVNTLSRVMIRY